MTHAIVAFLPRFPRIGILVVEVRHLLFRIVGSKTPRNCPSNKTTFVATLSVACCSCCPFLVGAK